MAYRTRLPGPQAGTWARALRGPRLAWLPPSRHALHRSLWLPGRRTGENSPLRICRPEAQSAWPSRQLSTPRRLRSDRSGTSRTQSPPWAGGSPWPWPKASSDVRAAQPTSAGLRTIPARDAVVLSHRSRAASNLGFVSVGAGAVDRFSPKYTLSASLGFHLG